MFNRSHQSHILEVVACVIARLEHLRIDKAASMLGDPAEEAAECLIINFFLQRTL